MMKTRNSRVAVRSVSETVSGRRRRRRPGVCANVGALLLLACLAACGSREANRTGRTVASCTTYAAELRRCVGDASGPATAMSAMTTAKDDAEYARMDELCQRELGRPRLSCR